MSVNEVSLVLKHVKKFPNSVLNLLPLKGERGLHIFFLIIFFFNFVFFLLFEDPQDAIGGIINKGKLGWIASGSHLEVVSLKTGNRVASYTFDNAGQYVY